MLLLINPYISVFFRLKVFSVSKKSVHCLCIALNNKLHCSSEVSLTCHLLNWDRIYISNSIGKYQSINPKLVVCSFIHWLNLLIGLELCYILAIKIGYFTTHETFYFCSRHHKYVIFIVFSK